MIGGATNGWIWAVFIPAVPHFQRLAYHMTMLNKIWHGHVCAIRTLPFVWHAPSPSLPVHFAKCVNTPKVYCSDSKDIGLFKCLLLLLFLFGMDWRKEISINLCQFLSTTFRWVINVLARHWCHPADSYLPFYRSFTSPLHTLTSCCSFSLSAGWLYLELKRAFFFISLPILRSSSNPR